MESGYFIGDDRSLFKYAVCGKYTIDGKVITKDMGNDWIEKDTIVELTNDKFVYISHLIADIHFSSRLAKLSILNGASKIRLNPGNLKDINEIKETIERILENSEIPNFENEFKSLTIFLITITC